MPFFDLPLVVISFLLRLYRRALSPDHGWLKPFFPDGVCRFSPTCSEYALLAIKRHRWRGLLLALRRVGRCHPFHRGGIDPVPECVTITKP